MNYPITPADLGAAADFLVESPTNPNFISVATQMLANHAGPLREQLAMANKLNADQEVIMAKQRAEIERLRGVEKAAGFCKEHKPNGGARNCLVCGCERLSSAVSQIAVICEGVHDTGITAYDVDCDETKVVELVRRLQAEARAVSASLLHIRSVAHRPIKDNDYDALVGRIDELAEAISRNPGTAPAPAEGVNGFSLKGTPEHLVDAALQVYARTGMYPDSRELHEAAMAYRAELIRRLGNEECLKEKNEQDVRAVVMLQSLVAEKDKALAEGAKELYLTAQDGYKPTQSAVSCQKALDLTPEVYRSRLDKVRALLKREQDYVKKMDALLDELGVYKSCINPYEDLRKSLTYLRDHRAMLIMAFHACDFSFGRAQTPEVQAKIDAAVQGPKP